MNQEEFEKNKVEIAERVRALLTETLAEEGIKLTRDQWEEIAKINAQKEAIHAIVG